LSTVTGNKNLNKQDDNKGLLHSKAKTGNTCNMHDTTVQADAAGDLLCGIPITKFAGITVTATVP